MTIVKPSAAPTRAGEPIMRGRRRRPHDRRPRPAAGRAADLRAGRLGRRPASTCPRPSWTRRDLGGLVRTAPIGLPGLSEPETLRHYVRLSQKNHAIDLAHLSARLVHDEAQPAPEREDGAPAGLRRHPSAAAAVDRAGRAGADGRAGALAEDADRHAGGGAVAQGRRARRALRPAGHPRGARGARRRPPHACWSRPRPTAPTPPPPPSPATRSMEIAQTDDGRVDLADLAAKLGPDVAAIMVTNPNTCGLFERDVIEIARLTHAAGAYFYCDGANFNAIVGARAAGRPRRRRHAHQPAQDLLDAARRRRAGRRAGGAVSAALAPFAPAPWVVSGADGFAPDRAQRGRGRRRPSAACAPSTARWACTCAR